MRKLNDGNIVKLKSGTTAIICDYYKQIKCYLVQIVTKEVFHSEFRIVLAEEIIDTIFC